METVNLLVKGKVQGVFYRASVRGKAEELGINGWVKNTPDGHVQILASGEEEALKEFIRWCHTGPSRAVVKSVSVTPQESSDVHGFRIIK